MIHFIHSYSTSPDNIDIHGLKIDRRVITNVWCYALSMAYIKKHNVPINLHTDNEGKELLGFLPYDNIYTTCEQVKTSGIHPRFWAAAKFFALEAEDQDAIHIDGDVFIKNLQCVNVDDDVDMLVQSVDISPAYKQAKEFLKHYYPGDDYIDSLFGKDNEDAYNTGVLYIPNKKLKKKIINQYFDIARHFSTADQKETLDRLQFFPDLIAEQMTARKLSQNYKVERVLKAEKLEDFTPEADEVGYQHLISYTKYYVLDKIKETLQKINPEIYQITLEKTTELEKQIKDGNEENKLA